MAAMTMLSARPRFGEVIAEAFAGSVFAIRPLLEYAAGDERREARGQDVARDAELVAKLREPGLPAQGVADDEK